MSLTPLADRPEDEKPQLPPDLSDSRFNAPPPPRRGVAGSAGTRAGGNGRGERRGPRGRRSDEKPPRHEDFYEDFEDAEDDSTRPVRGSGSGTRLRDRRGGRGQFCTICVFMLCCMLLNRPCSSVTTVAINVYVYALIMPCL